MKKNIKKLISSILLMALVCTGITYTPSKANAADDYNTLFEDTGNASSFQPITKTFSLKSNTPYAIGIYVPVRIDFHFELTNLTTNTILANDTIRATDQSAWNLSTNGLYYYALGDNAPTPGDYSVSISFAQDTQYALLGIQEKPFFYIDYESATVTKGFTRKLNAVNATGTVKWSTSNNKVATVNNGVVKGVSTGTAVITATDSTGSSFICIITVAKNEFKTAKQTLKNSDDGEVTIDIYHVYYKGGNLVAKANIINKTSRIIKQIKNFKVTFKTASGKVVCKTTVIKSKKLKVVPYSIKGLTLTIKKKNLKTKTVQNLRGGTCSYSYKYYTRRL